MAAANQPQFVGTPGSYQLLHGDLVGDTYGEGINDLGQVVGIMAYPDGSQHGFFANPLHSCTASTSIGSSFNGTRIPEGDSIWFDSNLSVSGLRLSHLAVRPRCRQALDLGTGCGLLAFQMASHSDRVERRRSACVVALPAGDSETPAACG